jgi:hypothetical protein
LNETFEIKNETINLDIGFSLEASIKEQDFQPDKLNNSNRKKGITASPLRMQGHNRTSTPKGTKFISLSKKNLYYLEYAFLS